jgi:hypothetical protein
VQSQQPAAAPATNKLTPNAVAASHRLRSPAAITAVSPKAASRGEPLIDPGRVGPELAESACARRAIPVGVISLLRFWNI